MRLNKIKAGCMMGSKVINYICYADDMVLLCSSLPGLRKALETCKHFAAEYGLIYNVNKTEFIVFQPEHKTYSVSGIKRCAQNVPRTTSVYLPDATDMLDVF